MDAQIERMCDLFDGVHCMNCGKVTDQFYSAYNSPVAPAVCAECAKINQLQKERFAEI